MVKFRMRKQQLFFPVVRATVCAAAVTLMVATGTLASTASTFPDYVFAPYSDAAGWPPPDFSDYYSKTGVKHFTMAFIVASTDGSGTATWGGYPSYGVGYLSDVVSALQSAGGNVIISFGGEAGTPLAEVHTDVTELQGIYQSVIDMYSAQWIDFDIEGGHIAEIAANERRHKALAALQVVNPDLKISFTLPSQPDTGLSGGGMTLLQNAKANNVQFDVVNAMTMYFGMYPTETMAAKTIAVAEKLGEILVDMYPLKTDSEIQSMIGLTPNIGVNTADEIFSLTDAGEVLVYAKAEGIRLLAMWSTGRDNGDCPGGVSYAPLCSGIAQKDYEFSRLFLPFTRNAAVKPDDKAGTILLMLLPGLQKKQREDM